MDSENPKPGSEEHSSNLPYSDNAKQKNQQWLRFKQKASGINDINVMKCSAYDN